MYVKNQIIMTTKELIGIDKMRKIIFFILMIISISSFGYTISNNGKNFIKKHETCKLTAYWDSNGYSIGWGHHTKEVYKGMKISQIQANNYFDKDIKEVEKAANRIINSLPYKYQFSQKFFDGLCSLVYNCGEGGVQRSEFYKRLKKCRVKNGNIHKNDLEYSIAGVKISRISCKGHISRRYDEHKLMLG